MRENQPLTGVLLEDACLTLEQLASAAAVSPEWIRRHIDAGCLAVLAQSAVEWRFSSRDLGRVQRMRVLERDFDAVPELAALVADLLEEVDALRLRLRRAGLD
jgi:chaperone modulatory protein CbpM